MTALSKFLVLLAIFLSASSGDAFVNHAQLNHLFRFDAPKSNPTNKPSRVPSGEPTSDQIQTTTSNTSYTFEAVNGVNHDHDKIRVDKRVTFEDSRDDEIQCGSRRRSITQSDWQGPKQQSFMLSARVPFAAFRSNLSSGFDCWVHSQTGCEPVTSTRGLCHGKKSEQAGCIASAQPSWLGPTYKEVSRSARVPFSTIYPFGGLSTICPFGGLSCMVRSHAVKVSVISSKRIASRPWLALSKFKSRMHCFRSNM